MLRQRVFAAVLGVPLLFFLLWLNWYLRLHGNADDLPILVMVVLLAGFSGWEISSIVRARFPHTGLWNGAYMAVILPFLLHSVRPAFGGTAPIGSVGLLIDSLGATMTVMLLFLAVWGDIENRGKEGAKENLYVLSAGLYVGVTLSFLLLLQVTRFGEMAIALLFVGVFALDTVAYFGGRLLGGVLLAPTISPKKTWSGAIIGLLGAVGFCMIFKSLPGTMHMLPWLNFALIGIGIGIAGQFGDLFESIFKRWGGVKDSGSVLPGHGGFLDRFDSLFLAAPVVFALLKLFSH